MMPHVLLRVWVMGFLYCYDTECTHECHIVSCIVAAMNEI